MSSKNNPEILDPSYKTDLEFRFVLEGKHPSHKTDSNMNKKNFRYCADYISGTLGSA